MKKIAANSADNGSDESSIVYSFGGDGRYGATVWCASGV